MSALRFQRKFALSLALNRECCELATLRSFSASRGIRARPLACRLSHTVLDIRDGLGLGTVTLLATLVPSTVRSNPCMVEARRITKSSVSVLLLPTRYFVRIPATLPLACPEPSWEIYFPLSDSHPTPFMVALTVTWPLLEASTRDTTCAGTPQLHAIYNDASISAFL
ncbi:hypothetical protein B0H16DRAFT_1005127 [Mycena metata]|uniref:Uncharacterized protein n=1 Tax=Mycena metata TaxID=1033252 RepID=A0AAD7NV57_9AGAR|nr:hypothetical protein B0H16DRAFT_1005127 [Mycena metata]